MGSLAVSEGRGIPCNVTLYGSVLVGCVAATPKSSMLDSWHVRHATRYWTVSKSALWAEIGTVIMMIEAFVLSKTIC